jgi:DNA-binding response OmpR family regulator
MKVLVLDDDEALGCALREILLLQNLDVDCVTSATDAIAKLGDKHYDVILVDYIMPQHDGIWFMNNAKLPRTTKVLLMTGHIERNVINTMFDLGVCGYLIKPFDEDELLRNLNFFLPGKLNTRKQCDAS